MTFRPYSWMRAIGRSDLPARCRNVLRCLAVEMAPGSPTVQISQRDLAELMGMTDRESISDALTDSERLGWLGIDEHRRPMVYTAKYPESDGRETQPPAVGKPDQADRPFGRETRPSDGRETRPNAETDGRDTRPSLDGKPDQAPITENKRASLLASSAPGGGTGACEDTVDDLRRGLADSGHYIAEDIAGELLDRCGRDYLVRRIVHDGLADRFESTGALLSALIEDAPPAPPDEPPPDTDPVDTEPKSSPPSPSRTLILQPPPPEVWPAVVDRLEVRVDTDALESWVDRLEPAGIDTGRREFVALATDTFFRDWITDRYMDLLDDALRAVTGDGDVSVRLESADEVEVSTAASEVAHG